MPYVIYLLILYEISFTLISLKMKSNCQKIIYSINIITPMRNNIFLSSLELFLNIITIIVDCSIFDYKRKENNK